MQIRAEDWNADRDRLAHACVIPGQNCQTRDVGNGIILSGEISGEWEHPWTISAAYVFLDNPPDEDHPGEWRAIVRPGFINGRDAHIEMPSEWFTEQKLEVPDSADVPLTDDPAPYLRLGRWRNPLKPATIGASLSGEIVFGAGEGYPKFFEKLGVKAAAKGGALGKIGAQDGEDDPKRTREIRAMDIVLTQPRIGTRLDVRLGEPIVDAQTQFLDTVFVSDYVRSTGGRAKLTARSKYEPIKQDVTLAAIYGALLDAGSGQFDQLKMATVWMVSPPNAGEDAEPDQTWVPYAQYFAFWNLCYAPRIEIKFKPDTSLKLFVPLALGLAQPIINGILSTINDNAEEASAFLNQSSATGKFWNT